jgi:hypothetical protein
LISWIKAKTDELSQSSGNYELKKYADLFEEAIVTSVTAVNQIYVDGIKKKNGFLTKDEQAKAFEMAKEKTINIIGDTGVKALGTLYEDFYAWLETRIEYYVSRTKLSPPHQ